MRSCAPQALAIFVAIACAVLVGCRTPPPPARVAQGQASVESTLANALTEGELTLFLGPIPKVCVDSAPGMKLCEWRVSKRNASWTALAPAVGTNDQVSILCELPGDGTPRMPGSCVGVPRRSDRYLYGGSEPDRTSAAAAATERVQSARTLVEISHLLGTAPIDCAWLRDGRRLCTWQANSRTYGHGTLCVGLGVGTRKSVTYRCELPGDGSPRKLESCRVD
jgi:hypothetical protein